MESGVKKRRKNYYKQCAKKQKRWVLEAGSKGILITCNNNEKQCVREAYNLLNEYADKIYGPENPADLSKAADAEDELESEITALKSTKTERRFQQVDTKVKNVLFIKTNVSDPVNIVKSIFEDLRTTSKIKTRYILKMTPVVSTCKWSEAQFKKCMKSVLQEYPLYDDDDDDSPVTYKVMCKIRHNNSTDSSHLTWYTRKVAEEEKPSWKQVLTSPKLLISIDVLQKMCCIAVLQNYELYKKYNLSEMSLATLKNATVSSTEKNFGETKADNTSDKTEADKEVPGVE